MDRVDYLPLYAGGANSQLPATERIWKAVLCQELLQGLPFELEDQVIAISPEKCLCLPDDGRHVKCNDLPLSLSFSLPATMPFGVFEPSLPAVSCGLNGYKPFCSPSETSSALGILHTTDHNCFLHALGIIQFLDLIFRHNVGLAI